jgi:hypothetical protein
LIGLDAGLKNDRSVLSVCHSERSSDGAAERVVLDRMEVLQGTRDRPVQLGDVEALAVEASRQFGHARIVADPWQTIGMLQRLRDRGIDVNEWAFTSQSVGRLGATLHTLLRDHRLALPPDQELLDELATVRLRESAPGVLRLDHDAGKHDDMAVSLGLAALTLAEHPDTQSGGFSIPRAILAARKATDSARIVNGRPISGFMNPAYQMRASRGTLADFTAAQRNQTEAQRRAGLGLVVPGSANDPSRVKRV